MKEITKEEYNKLKIVNRGEINMRVFALHEGEVLFISREEWKKKGYRQNPQKIVRASVDHPKGRLHGMKVWTKTTKEGWVIGKGKLEDYLRRGVRKNGS